MATIKVVGNEIAIIDGKDSLASKLITGCKGKITIKSPYTKGGIREVKLVDKISEPEIVKSVVEVAEVMIEPKKETPKAEPKATTAEKPKKKTTKKAK